MNAPRLLTLVQAAAYCRMTRDAFLMACVRREIDSTRDDRGRWRVSADELDSYLAWGPSILGEHAGVYFIQCGQRGPFKIGHTESTKRRLAEAQTFSPWALQLRAIILDSGKDVEREVHLVLGASRMRGEWFEASEMVLAVVRDIRTWPMAPPTKPNEDDAVVDPVVAAEVRRMTDICLGRSGTREERT